MNRKTKLTKFLSVVLAATLLFSAVPTSGFATAAEGDGGNATGQKVSMIAATVDNTFFANTGASLVKDLPTAYHVDNINGTWVEREGIQEGTSGYLIDGEVTDKYYYNAIDKRYTNANHYMCSRRGYVTKRTDDQKDQYGSDIAEIKVDGTEYAVDIVHDLQKVEKIEKVLIAHHENKVLRSGHYRLYVSKDESTLFNDESLVYEHKNLKGGSTPRGQAFTFTKTEARFVAIRVFNPYSTSDHVEIRSGFAGTATATQKAGNAYIRMYEFNVFGAVKDAKALGENRKYDYQLTQDPKPDKEDPKYPEYTYNEEISKKNSLVAGHAPEEMFFKVGETEAEAFTVAAGSTVNAAWLTDNDSETVTEIQDSDGRVYKFLENNAIVDSEENKYLQLNYKLDAEAKVDYVNLFYHENDQFGASHIKVSVADTADNLFSEGSYISNDIYSAFGNVTKVKLTGAPTGKYVGIRIICPVKKSLSTKDYAYTRLAEISIYGNYTAVSGGVEYKYTIEGSTLTKNGNVKIEYESNPDTSEKYPAGTTATITLAASVRDSESNLHSLKNWTVTNPTISGTDTVISIKMETDKTAKISAVYGVSQRAPVTITFKNYWGEVIHSAKVTYGHYLSRGDYEIANSKLGDVPGKELKYAEYYFGSRIAEMPVWNEDIYNYAAGADITFTPVYVTSDKIYDVTVTAKKTGLNSTTQKPEEISYTETIPCRFNQKIICEDSEAKYWTVDDQPWCMGSTFVGYVTEEMTIKPSKETLTGTKIALGKEPVITGSSVGFAARIINLPEGATIKGYGLVLVSGDSEVTEITSANCQQLIRANKRSGGDFMVTVTNMPRKVTRRARAYIVYDVATIGTVTIYSEEVAITMP